MRLLFIVFASALAAQTTVPVAGTAVIPAGTFQAPIAVQAPLSLSGLTLTCPTCVSTTPSGTTAGLFSPDRPSGTMAVETHKGLVLPANACTNILAPITGSGYISEMFIASFVSPSSNVVVTIDGETTPSINVIIKDLLGDDYLDSQPNFGNAWMVGNHLNNDIHGTFKLPIPFGSSAQVQLCNNTATISNATTYVVYHTGVPDTWPFTQRLHLATFNQNSGLVANQEIDMVNVTPNKHGKLAGVGWIYDGFPGGVSPRTAPLEAPFKIYIDGATMASYVTSGSEDFFGTGDYFNGYGVNANIGPDQSLTVLTGDTWGAQRFFIRDPITFNTGLRVTWTCGVTSVVNFTGTCSLHSTVYYYTEN